jgi:hypothetical protein
MYSGKPPDPIRTYQTKKIEFGQRSQFTYDNGELDQRSRPLGRGQLVGGGLLVLLTMFVAWLLIRYLVH